MISGNLCCALTDWENSIQSEKCAQNLCRSVRDGTLPNAQISGVFTPIYLFIYLISPSNPRILATTIIFQIAQPPNIYILFKIQDYSLACLCFLFWTLVGTVVFVFSFADKSWIMRIRLWVWIKFIKDEIACHRLTAEFFSVQRKACNSVCFTGSFLVCGLVFPKFYSHLTILYY